MRGRPLKMTVTARKASAWKAFSEWVRRNNQDSIGFNTCYTCGISKHFTEMQAGHGIGGRNNAVLFMEEVVRPQCERCNGFLNGNYSVFTMKLMDELGVKKYQNLVILSNQVVKWTPSDFLAIENYYRGKLEELT